MTPELMLAQRLVGLIALYAVTACASSDPSSDLGPTTEPPATTDVGYDIELPGPSAGAVQWNATTELPVDDHGAAGWVSIPYPAGQRYVAVRTLPVPALPAAARPCHRVTAARLASGLELPADHVVPGPGAGVFVWSTTDQPLDVADELQLQLGLYDCELGIPASRARFGDMPSALQVDAAWEAAIDEGRTGYVDVRMAVAEDSGWRPSSEDAAVADAWRIAAERFADVGIELRLRAEGPIEAVGPVEYGPDMLGFDALAEEVRARLSAGEHDTRFVPVVWIGCLQHDRVGVSSRPHGQASRIPGSIADPRSPSLVAVAAGDCSGTGTATLIDPERIGLVLAHELGHYLGVRHVDAGGAHLSGDLDEQLMHSAIASGVPSDAAWFSPAQGKIMRRHPVVVFD